VKAFLKKHKISISLGIVSGFLMLLLEVIATKLFNPYFLNPWIGFHLRLPSLLALYFSLDVFSRKLKSRLSIEPLTSLVMSSVALLVFLIIGDLIIFPMFAVPVILPWHDLIIIYRFPEGLIDVFANSVLIMSIGLYVQKKYFANKSHELKNILQEMIRPLLTVVKIGFFAYSAFAILFIASKNEIKSPIFLLEILINWLTPPVETIRIVVWLVTLYFVEHALRQNYLNKANRILFGNIIANSVLNALSSQVQIMFLFSMDLREYYENISWITILFAKFTYALQSYLLVLVILTFSISRFIEFLSKKQEE